MKNFIVIGFVSVVLLFAIVGVNANNIFEGSSYSIKIGDKNINNNHTAFMNNDSIYVSLRNICEELRIPVTWNDKSKEATIGINNKEVEISERTRRNENGVVPDAETAINLGKIILEKYTGKDVEYESDKYIYYLKATFLEEENTWLVVQNIKYKHPYIGSMDGGADFIHIKISRGTGEVLYINDYSTFGD